MFSAKDLGHPFAQDGQGEYSGGEYIRSLDAFTDWVREDGSSGFPAAAGRYHLYVSYACPWAHRTIIARRLKGLESVVGMSVVDPLRDEEHGWAFCEGRDHGGDPVEGFRFLREAYLLSDPGYRARVTVPVLWDAESRKIVSNNDDHIMRMLNREFDAFTDGDIDLCPAELEAEIDDINELVYHTVNDGVYRSGFADTQTAYEKHVRRLFQTLDQLEQRLSAQRYLVGERITEADWRLFVTLVRFDAVYHGHFKCNLRRIVDCPHLLGYLRELYQVPGIADTVNFDHIKRHYYMTHDGINPTGIVPLGPDQDLLAPHGRDRLFA
ncbi:MAG: glutathione S-transferase family protein [Candidatus Latescibacterota bacterium]|nr:glutathione S-transferase family protein [Candidatus Latescibacterota bacterium]